MPNGSGICTYTYPFNITNAYSAGSPSVKIVSPGSFFIYWTKLQTDYNSSKFIGLFSLKNFKFYKSGTNWILSLSDFFSPCLLNILIVSFSFLNPPAIKLP